MQRRHELFGAVEIFGYEQFQRGLGGVHTPGGVDLGRERIGHRGRGNGLARQREALEQSDHAGAGAVLQRGKSVCDQRAVFAGQWHDIRHGTEGDEIEIIVQHRAVFAVFERGGQL